MKKNHSENLNVIEGSRKKIIVITDLVSEGCYERGMTMTVPETNLFAHEAERCGFDREDFVFVNPSPPVPEESQGSDSKTAKFLADHREEMMKVVNEYIRNGASAVLTLGKWGTRQFMGRAVDIRKARGTLQTHESEGREIARLALLSPKEVLRFPDRRDIYNTDFLQLRSLADQGWNVTEFREAAQGSGYKWCLDLSELINDPPKCIALDCETVGADRYAPEFRLLTVQITRRKGESLVVPLDIDWWNDATLFSDASANAPRLNERLRAKLLNQIRTLVANPDVHCVGHNLKFDIHALEWANIEVANWYADTMQLAFVVDENMQNKGLDDCVRRWLPQFSGYADSFNERVDKSKMQFVEHRDFLEYAGGDTDVSYRLANVLLKEAKQDQRQWDTFVKIQMPALRAFLHMERQGVRIDTNELTQLEQVLGERERELYREIMSEVPVKVLKEFEGNWKITPAFIAAVLFGENGIRVNENGDIDMANGTPLIPVVFTKAKNEPSTSAKDHLPYFEHVQFVRKLIEYSKLGKMRGTYVGKDAHEIRERVDRLKNGGLPKYAKDAFTTAGLTIPDRKAVRQRRPNDLLVEQLSAFSENAGKSVSEMNVVIPFSKGELSVDSFGNIERIANEPASGFWKYLKNRETEPRIHPSFFLHRTNTGRTASADPNAQNFPKRGALAEAYRRIFVPTPGYVFIESDLSQAEIRIAAWMANETEMLRIYNAGGDIHSAVAAAVMEISEDKFNAGLHDESLLADVARSWPGAVEWMRAFPVNKRGELTVAKFCKAKRQQAKAVVFGFIYGMGWRKFMVYARTDYSLIFTEREAQHVREAFFAKFPRLASWHQQMRTFVNTHGYVRALHGALRRLPNIESDDDMIQGVSSRQAINAPVQRFASDLGLIALSRFVRDADHDAMRPVLFIHDANVIEAREDVAEEAAAALKFYMQSPPLEHWFGLHAPLPIVADVSIGHSLGAMIERPDIEALAPSWYRRGEEPPTLDPLVSRVWAKKKRRSIILTDA